MVVANVYILTPIFTTNNSSLLLQIVDVGLGSLDKNVANVFFLLGNITNNLQAINTYANMNASIQVLLSLSQKPISITEESAINVSITESLIIFMKSYYWVSTKM